MELLRAFATLVTIVAALMVAANWSARVTATGFGLFIIASIAWLIDGWLEPKASLVVQNGILLLINIAGLYRWLPKAKTD